MRPLFLVLAAVLSLVAVVTQWTTAPAWLAPAALIAAGLSLAAWLALTFTSREAVTISLSDDQRATVRRAKEGGNMTQALRLVRSWNRGATSEEVARAVREA